MSVTAVVMVAVVVVNILDFTYKRHACARLIPKQDMLEVSLSRSHQSCKRLAQNCRFLLAKTLQI